MSATEVATAGVKNTEINEGLKVNERDALSFKTRTDAGAYTAAGMAGRWKIRRMGYAQSACEGVR